MSFSKDHSLIIAVCCAIIALLGPFIPEVNMILVIASMGFGLYWFMIWSDESSQKEAIKEKVFSNSKSEFENYVAQNFKLKPCATCADVDYVLIDINSVGTAVQLK